MEMDEGFNKAAAGACGIGAARILLPPPPPPEKATTPTLTAPDKCYEKTGGEEATFMETAKDYLSQFKDMPAEEHWDCIENRARATCGYVAEKIASAFGRKRVEPVVKDDPPEVEKPAPVESQ